MDRGFADGVLALIRQGHLQRVEYLVGEAIRTTGSPEFQAAAAASEDVTIAGWDEIAADMRRADTCLTERYGRPSAAVSLDLVNRDDEARLLIARRFDVEVVDGAPNRHAGSWAPPYDASPVVVEGLEPLMAIQRRKLPPGTDARDFEGAIAEQAFAGLLLLARYHAVVARHLLHPGLPRAVLASVGVESVEWPMEQGVYEYGPFAGRRIDVATVQRDTVAAQAKVEEDRRANKAHYDFITAQLVTEMREKRFLLQHWPWSTESDKRREAIETFDANLALTFVQMMGEPDAPAWNLPEAQFEARLRRFAEYRNAADVDAVLGRFDSDERSQLHLTFMNYALQFGGREVQKHWLRSRGHAV